MADLIRADVFNGFRPLVRALGGDPEALLRAAQIDPAVIDEPDVYIAYSRVVRVFEHAAAELGCPDFGMRLAMAALDTMGPLSTAVLNSETAREAVAYAARFVRFHTQTRIAIEPADGPDEELIAHELPPTTPAQHAQEDERIVAYAHLSLQRLCGPLHRPCAVWFHHAPCAPAARYRAVFGLAPAFGHARCGLVLTRAQLDARLQARDPHLRRMAHDYLDSFGGGAAAPVAERVRAALSALVRSGGGGQGEIARAMAMHERTLQRRLKAEGVRFEAIKDEVRRDLALKYLVQRHIPISLAADLLGFAEPAAFTRSCRRWFGETPRAVRKRLTENRPA